MSQRRSRRRRRSRPSDGALEIDEIPFDFVRRRLSIAVCRGPDRILISKGAPEEILRICSFIERNGTITAITVQDREEVSLLYRAKSTDGFRTLAVRYRDLEHEQLLFSVDDERDMTLIGLVTFIDPPKEPPGNRYSSWRSRGSS